MLRPSFGTMCEIEDALGKGGSELVSGSDLSMKQSMTIIWLAAKGTDDNENVPKLMTLGEQIRKQYGGGKAARIALQFLVNGILSDEQRVEVAEEAARIEAEEETKDADPKEPEAEPAKETEPVGTSETPENLDE